MQAMWMAVVAACAGAGAIAGPAAAQQTDQPRTVESTGKAIVESPLRDLNIIKVKVPPLLEGVMAEPYSVAGVTTCPQFKARIAELTEVLGPDVDSKAARAQGNGASEFALGAAQDVAGSFIPGGGLIRRVSGAAKAQKHAQAAVYAGSVRRAYLKATARAKGCKV